MVSTGVWSTQRPSRPPEGDAPRRAAGPGLGQTAPGWEQPTPRMSRATASVSRAPPKKSMAVPRPSRHRARTSPEVSARTAETSDGGTSAALGEPRASSTARTGAASGGGRSHAMTPRGSPWYGPRRRSPGRNAMTRRASSRSGETRIQVRAACWVPFSFWNTPSSAIGARPCGRRGPGGHTGAGPGAAARIRMASLMPTAIESTACPCITCWTVRRMPGVEGSAPRRASRPPPARAPEATPTAKSARRSAPRLGLSSGLAGDMTIGRIVRAGSQDREFLRIRAPGPPARLAGTLAQRRPRPAAGRCRDARRAKQARWSISQRPRAGQSTMIG